MEAIYFLGCKISGLVFGGIWLMCVLAQLAFNSFSWIDDKGCEVLKPFEWFLEKVNVWRPDMGDFFAIFGGGGVFVILISIFIWPIIYPCFIVCGIMYSLRHFKRFQKKIKEALGSKADKEHKHKQDDIILND